jgi:DNA-binding CsgD family transcriptional regulator
VLRGEAGSGKSALLAYVHESLDGWHIAKAVGVESEMELAYSGLHQLCAQMIDRLELLPVPQRTALAIVFGLSEGGAPDKFLVGLATLTLLAEAAEQQPLVCIVDDAQWLDHASEQILAFVARRLHAERIALVCSARIGIGDDILAGLPDLPVSGLGYSDARALLLENVQGPLDAAVCDQIIAESHGNPLALLELPRTWNAADVAGGFGLPAAQPLVGKIEESYAKRLRLLPSDTRLLVLAAAAEPLGDPVLLHRAAETMGLDMASVGPAVDSGQLSIGGRVEFAHPLVRSAAYRSAVASDRHRVHHALAEATDAETDPDRRAWHRARATAGHGEDVAAELERSASRAQARGGLAASAAFLERAALLTPESAGRAARMLTAAHAKRLAGMPADASALLAKASAGPLDALQRATAQRLRGELALDQSHAGNAASLLLEAARCLEPFDPALARETYLEALTAASVAGRFSEGMLDTVARAARMAPPATELATTTDLLLDGLAVLLTEGIARAAPILKQALASFRDDDDGSAREVHWQWIATRIAVALFDDESLERLNTRYVRAAREAGALGILPNLLNHLAALRTLEGALGEAATALDEADRIAAACGRQRMFVGRAWLAACRGDEREFLAINEVLEREATALEDDATLMAGAWARAAFHNSRGEYEAALAAAQPTQVMDELGVSSWAAPELIEAAIRCGRRDIAAEAHERLSARARASGTEVASGLEAASRALLNEGETAERAYREAVERLSSTRMRMNAARVRLLYGEWLRREGRRVDAQVELNAAHDFFSGAGAAAFAERARRELTATGQKVRRRSTETRDALTPQESQIAAFARDGFSNAEIGGMLYLSPRTVEWHLRKVFSKLGIGSRRQLREALPGSRASLAL